MKFLNFLKKLVGIEVTKIAEVQETAQVVEAKVETANEVVVTEAIKPVEPKVEKTVKAKKPIETAKDIKSKAKKPTSTEEVVKPKKVAKKLPAKPKKS